MSWRKTFIWTSTPALTISKPLAKHVYDCVLLPTQTWKTMEKYEKCTLVKTNRGDARPPKQTYDCVAKYTYKQTYYNRWTTVLYSFVFHFSTNLSPTFLCICWCSFEQSFEGSGSWFVFLWFTCRKYSAYLYTREYNVLTVVNGSEF